MKVSNWWLTFDGHEARNDIFISWCLKSRMSKHLHQIYRE